MNCPEHLVIGWRWVYVWMYWRDVRRETIPLRIWLNPLRYEVSFRFAGRRLCINREGLWAGRIPASLWQAWCKAFGHKPKSIGTAYVYCDRCHKPLREAIEKVAER